ncbi:MAG TPA: hypothetical protein V6C72_11905, partial [Chroococcales cyanobacterium]
MITSELTRASLTVKLALALTAMATIAVEVSLTRLFSATAGYHFAFMIVSMTMFGMTAGALFTFVRPPRDGNELYGSLSFSAALVACSLPIAYVAQGFVNDAMAQIGALAWISLIFVLYSIPFFFSGVCVSLCLSRFAEVGTLYAYDLIGAALGCPLLIAGLTYGDPQSLIAFCGAALAVASACFACNRSDISGRHLIAGFVGLTLSIAAG